MQGTVYCTGTRKHKQKTVNSGVPCTQGQRVRRRATARAWPNLMIWTMVEQLNRRIRRSLLILTASQRAQPLDCRWQWFRSALSPFSPRPHRDRAKDRQRVESPLPVGRLICGRRDARPLIRSLLPSLPLLAFSPSPLLSLETERREQSKSCLLLTVDRC